MQKMASARRSGPILIALFLSFFAIGWQPALFAADKKTDLAPEQVSALLPQLFKLHLSQKEMNVPFMKRVLKEFLNHLDPAKQFFLKEEADAVLKLSDDELSKLAERSLAGDFTFYNGVVKSFLEKQIGRDAALYDGLDNRAEDVKAQLLKDKSAKVASAQPEKTPGTAATGADAGKDVAAKDEDEDPDQIKWTERPATNAERELRLLRSTAALFRINKSYLSEQEALKQAVNFMREERKKWLTVKADVETPKLFLKSFMAAMDPHTVYFDADEDEEFVGRLEPSFAGIGVQIRPCPLGAQVEDIIKGGPTERSGRFAPGDQIIRVDDFPLAGLPINKIVRRIKGEKGTEVKLTVLKRESKQTELVTLKRDTINLAEMRVKGKTFDTPKGTIGLISVQSFYRGVHGDVKERIKEVSKEKPLAGLVLDLRDNHGGYLEEAVGLAGLFIAAGPVVGERDGRNIVSWKSDPDASMFYSGPLVLLTNQFSASASEIVAGTLKDYNRGVVVAATQTFGKGTVQRVIPLSTLPMPGEIKITTHQYFLAGGDSVQQRGVAPDVAIPGPKLGKDMLESSNENAVPFNKIPGKIDKANPDVAQWTSWKEKNVAMLQEKSKLRTDSNQEFKDAFDVKKRRAKFAELEAKKANLKPDEAPPVEDVKKKDEKEKDFHAEEAVAVVGDMVESWGKPATAASAAVGK